MGKSSDSFAVDWPQMVDAMYTGDVVSKEIENGEEVYFIGKEIDEKTDFDPVEVQDVLSYMDKIGLVREVTDGGMVGLSELGLRLAHERKMDKRQSTYNFLLMGATWLLVLGTIVQSVIMLVTRAEGNRVQLMVGVIMAGLVVIITLRYLETNVDLGGN